MEVQKILWDAGLYAEVDLSDNTLNKKIRNGEIAQHNFILSQSLCIPPPPLSVDRESTVLTSVVS